MCKRKHVLYYILALIALIGIHMYINLFLYIYIYHFYCITVFMYKHNNIFLYLNNLSLLFASRRRSSHLKYPNLFSAA